MTDVVFRQIIDGHGFCHEHGIVAASDDECCPYCGATAHGVEMVRLAKETRAEITRLQIALDDEIARASKAEVASKAEIKRLREKNARLCRMAEIDPERQ